jgi:GNAT superfamily N-acetyltransferase
MKRNGLEIVVRSAKPQDVPNIARLSGQLGYPFAESEMRKRFESIENKKKHEFFVAELKGAIVGWLEIFIPVSVLDWSRAEIGALVVDETARRSGAGTKLVRRAERWAYDHHCFTMVLRSSITRNDSHAFYSSLGYSVQKTQNVFRKELN